MRPSWCLYRMNTIELVIHATHATAAHTISGTTYHRTPTFLITCATTTDIRASPQP